MPVRFRRGRPGDVRRGWRWIESERALFSSQTWARLSAILEDLVAREKLTLCVFEDVQSREVVSMGARCFGHPEFLQAAVAHPGLPLLEQIFSAEIHLRPALLNEPEIARANRRGTLELLNFFASPDFDDPNPVLEVGMIFEAAYFFNKGFHLNGFWQENATPRAAEALVVMGFQRHRVIPTALGPPAALLHASAEYARSAVGSFLGTMMVSPAPRFAFTAAEQRLLETALLDFSDREAAEMLDVSADAIKKRWRSIYSKVEALEPGLWGAQASGADRRRILLGRIRGSLEELRPWAE